LNLKKDIITIPLLFIKMILAWRIIELFLKKTAIDLKWRSNEKLPI
jgi:hypothetical protein